MSGDPEAEKYKKAIEIWSLYSYNLHKATFQGLQKLNTREKKRNFIIGRGSFAGAQRFAGLWTGDNASSWEFLDISVAQVLSLGLAGLAMSGADVGGFEPKTETETWWADPELLIRWYCAYSLLPWFRNHYSGKEGKKKFQEPYAFRELQDSEYWKYVPEEHHNMYYSVLPICRYVVQLRYSLLQLLYDAMFENVIGGLPIARAMVITDALDESLFKSNQWYTRSQYVVGKDLLVAPCLIQERKRKTRKLYLPNPDSWYPMNLRPGTRLYKNGILAEALKPKAFGGTYIEYDCHISPSEEQLPFATPMYIREGAIIPQTAVHSWVPDRLNDDKNSPANQLSINIYPGKDNSYDMYLDDGVSRDSAPNDEYLSTLGKKNPSGDTDAKNKFRHVKFEQKTTRELSGTQLRDVRRITVSIPHSEYEDEKVVRDIGEEYRFVVWHAPMEDERLMNMNEVEVKVEGDGQVRAKKIDNDQKLCASVVLVSVRESVEYVIKVSSPA